MVDGPAYSPIQFAMMRPPIGVNTLSGWNCTPHTLYRTCRTAMMTPDPLWAVARSTGGKVAGSAAQLW